MQTTSELLAIGLVTVAAVIDIWRQRIPNVLTIGGGVAGFVLAAMQLSDVLIGASILGCGAGLLLMLPGYALGATGAGDVKLMAAIGAVAGVQRVVTVFLCAAVAGGLLAIAYAAARGRFGMTLVRTAALVRRPTEARMAIESPDPRNRFPYGPAIAVGTILALWPM